MGVAGAIAGREIPRPIVAKRGSQRAFFGVSAVLFAASVAVTIVWYASMSAMGEMPTPGGWTMSMAWTRMPGRTWVGAAASFMGMWVVMMVANDVAVLGPNAVALLPGRRHDRRDAPRLANHARGRRLLLCLDRGRNGRACGGDSCGTPGIFTKGPSKTVSHATGRSYAQTDAIAPGLDDLGGRIDDLQASLDLAAASKLELTPVKVFAKANGLRWLVKITRDGALVDANFAQLLAIQTGNAPVTAPNVRSVAAVASAAQGKLTL